MYINGLMLVKNLVNAIIVGKLSDNLELAKNT
jgi:hypothetical protein